MSSINISVLFISLILAHVVGDFYLQTDNYCNQKKNEKLKSWFLYVHSIVIGLLSWLIVFRWDFGLWALVIAISHFIIDAIKVHFPNGLWSFVIDQLSHVAVLWFISDIFGHHYKYTIIACLAELYEYPAIDCVAINVELTLIILAILLSLKPANILIKLILKKYQLGESESCNDIKNAGALIGNLERVLTIVFVIIGQYQAVGFIIAAKSILRFKDTDIAKTEYVLAGTFLSFGIAILCGLIASGPTWIEYP